MEGVGNLEGGIDRGGGEIFADGGQKRVSLLSGFVFLFLRCRLFVSCLLYIPLRWLFMLNPVLTLSLYLFLSGTFQAIGYI